MAPPKKDFYNCAHCGRTMSATEGDDGYNYRKPADGIMHQISCPCGIMTKMCKKKGELQEVWNSKPKKSFVAEKITVKHPPARGTQPDDVQLNAQGGGDPF